MHTQYSTFIEFIQWFFNANAIILLNKRTMI